MRWENPSGGAKKMIMVHGDDQEMIKCSTWKRRKRKTKIGLRQRYKQKGHFCFALKTP
jgi:hypothetical protein